MSKRDRRITDGRIQKGREEEKKNRKIKKNRDLDVVHSASTHKASAEE
jgi:hypothetical protein